MPEEIKLDLDELKRLAEAATTLCDGAPWAYEPHGDSGYYGVGVLVSEKGSYVERRQESCSMAVCVPVAPEVSGQVFAAFIAASNPSTVLTLIAENERLKTLRSTTERDLAQELEVWRKGPSCWSCGDTGDVHDLAGEWRGQCDCNAAKLIDAASERDQLKAENKALRKDAERYQWLRERDLETLHRGGVFAGQTPRNVVLNGEDLDEAIDAAMSKEVSP